MRKIHDERKIQRYIDSQLRRNDLSREDEAILRMLNEAYENKDINEILKKNGI